MSKENVDAFWAMVEATNRGDVDAVLRYMDDDVVFIPIRAATEGEFPGHDGIRAFFADTEETFEVFEAGYPDVRDLGDRVLGLGSIHIRGKGSGVEADVPSAPIFTFRAGKVIRLEDPGDHARAIELVGLSE